jgi:hypothetical protein
VLPASDAGRRRWWALLLLALIVGAIHLWLAGRYGPTRLGAAQPPMQRIEVAFVRELAPAEPPVAAAPPPPPAPRLARLRAALPAASAPPGEPEPGLAAEPVAAPLDTALLPALPELASVAPVPAALAAAASADTAFDWPPSTRLSYTLTGQFRGPVEGQAQVEWLRDGNRYQVHMDVSVGPAFAPLFTRRVSSEGLITPEGLYPRRYDEQTRALLAAPRQLTIKLGDDWVSLPNGWHTARPPGVQDSASQSVQLTWLFITEPARLTPGSSLELPLALPQRVEPWIYEVVERVSVATPVGEVETLHVRPRRESRAGGELTPEMWVAPSLQYLPVRMLIRRDAETWIDLLIERLPQQAAPGR